MRGAAWVGILIGVVAACGKESGASNRGCGSSTTTTTTSTATPTAQRDAEGFSFASVGSGEWAGESGNVRQASGITGLWASGTVVIAVGTGFVYRSTDRGIHFTREATDVRARFPVVWGVGNEIYIGGEGGVFHSLDGGQSFARTTTDVPGGVVQAVNGHGADDVLVAGGVPPFVARTTDHAATWEKLATPMLADGWLYGLAVTEDGSEVFLSGKEGTRKTPAGMQGTSAVVLHSPDHGATWDRLPIFKKEGTDFEQSRQVCFASGTLFAASSYALFMTRDLGKTWQLATNVGTEVLALACRGNDVIVGGRNRALFVSRDLGATWKNNPLGSLFKHQALVSVQALAISDTGEVYVGFEGLYDTKRGSVFRRSK